MVLKHFNENPVSVLFRSGTGQCTVAAAMQERKKITFFHHLGYESSPRQVYDALMMDGCEFRAATGTSNLDE